MPRKSAKTPDLRRMRGFEQAGGLLRERVRSAGASRGFAVTRLLTHWNDIVGAEVAAIARPVKVGFRRDGLGATLTLLTSGAQAPMLEMQKETIRERVNACYGYNAISRVSVTQTAPTGFAEGKAAFDPAPARDDTTAAADPVARRRAAMVADGVLDPGLRAALESMGQKVLTRSEKS